MLGLRSTSLLSSFRAVRPTLVAQRQQFRAFGGSSVASEPAATKGSTTAAKKTSETKATKPKAKTTTKAKAKSPVQKKEKKEKKPKPESKRLTPAQKALMPPKKPSAPYLRFFTGLLRQEKERRQAAGETIQLAGANMLAKEASAAWKEMTLTEKAKYAIPEEEIQQYNRDHAHWVQNIDRNTLDAINKKRKLNGKSRITAPEGLKRPLGTYPLYIKDFYAKHVATDLSPEEKATTVLMAKAAETWKTLSDGEKQVYRDRAEVLKREYLAREEAAAKVKAES